MRCYSYNEPVNNTKGTYASDLCSLNLILYAFALGSRIIAANNFRDTRWSRISSDQKL